MEAGPRVYRLQGTPFEIGHAMGRALGARLAANIRRYVRARTPAGVPFDAARWRSGALPWLRSLPARFQAEFEGLAQGAKIPLQRIAEWVYLEVALAGQCSGAVVGLEDHLWVARNNDSFAPGLWGYVTIRDVVGRIPTASFGLEGDIFTATGINRERLWLHYNYLPVRDAPVAGKPHLPGYALMVEALETCRTLRDVEALLDRVQRDGGMLLFAVEGRTDTCALYECTCTEVYKRELTGGWIVGTNHYSANPRAPSAGAPASSSTVRRYARMEALIGALASQEGKVAPVPALVEALADGGVEAREGETVTVYANVTCPATGTLWYTFGGCPAASGGNWQQLPWPW
jgi:hypothetical protein